MGRQAREKRDGGQRREREARDKVRRKIRTVSPAESAGSTNHSHTHLTFHHCEDSAG